MSTESCMMDEMEMRRYLNRAFYADKKAKALDMLVKQCRDRAQKLSRGTGDNPSSGGAGSSTESALMKLAEMEEQAEKQRRSAIEVTSEIRDKISELHDDDLEAVLIHRYILFHTSEETAELLHYHPNTVKNKDKKAIRKLCTELS